jgi:peptide/nickel transport system substrate-binding protein
LETEQEAGNLVYSFQTGSAWELAAFGVNTLSQRYDWFGLKEVRQAIAMCIDRDVIVDELLYGVPQVPDTYVPENHPYFESTTSYSYDPEAAGDLLTAAGWIDHDDNPQTPRISNGLANIPDGTSLAFSYLVSSDAERPETARYIKNNLAGCGIEVEINTQDWESLMTPGPEGFLFGRNFEMAQFAWSTSVEPACRLFMSEEIPGPYPEFPKGWGGANLSGYSSTAFDEACLEAMSTLPGGDANMEAHHTAQEIFAEELPVLPLYQRIHLVAVRPDMCEPLIDPAANSALIHLEEMDYGEACE